MNTSTHPKALAVTVALSVLAAVLCVGAGSARTIPGGPTPPRHQAVAFLTGVVGDLAANRYDVAWERLAPAQQRLVPRSTYVRCESLSPVPGRLVSIVPRWTRTEEVELPGAPSSSVASVAVRFDVRIAGSLEEGFVTVPVTAHALWIDRRWRWMLPARRLQQHRAPSCGMPAYGGPAGAL